MTNAAAVSYAAVLLDLDVAPEMVAEAEQTFRTYPQLTDVLSNPTISEAEKFAVIDRLFPQPLQRYLHVVCRNERMDSILEIFSEYHSMERQRRHCAHAILEYVTPLTDAQLSAMKKNGLRKNRQSGGAAGAAPESGIAGRLSPADRRRHLRQKRAPYHSGFAEEPDTEVRVRHEYHECK